MEIFFTIVITLGLSVALIALFEICKNSNKQYDVTSYNELSNEEEIIILLRNIAKNQKTIKTNTTIIAVIMLVPILISIFILATGTSILSTLFN